MRKNNGTPLWQGWPVIISDCSWNQRYLATLIIIVCVCFAWIINSDVRYSSDSDLNLTTPFTYGANPTRCQPLVWELSRLNLRSRCLVLYAKWMRWLFIEVARSGLAVSWIQHSAHISTHTHTHTNGSTQIMVVFRINHLQMVFGVLFAMKNMTFSSTGFPGFIEFCCSQQTGDVQMCE